MMRVPNPHTATTEGVDWAELRRLRGAGSVLETDDSTYLLTRHAEVSAALKNAGDPPAFSHSFTLRGPAADVPAEHQLMSEMEGPRHTRRRKLLLSALHPRLVRNAAGFVETLANRLLDDLLLRGGGDLVANYARPIPAQTLAHVIGLPVEDHRQFQQWSDEVVFHTGTNSTDLSIAHPEFARYLDNLAEQRRRSPKLDLITEIVQPHRDGDEFNQAEIRTLIMHLVVAGNETTAHLIAHLLRRLIQEPRLLATLAGTPAAIPAAVEESLRVDPPVVMRPIQATRDVTIGDGIVPAGSRVIASIASANRDEASFQHPDEFDFSRPNVSEHVAFGGGAHFCPGAALARMEAGVAASVFTRRVGSAALEVGWEPRWVPVLWANGLSDLVAALSPRLGAAETLRADATSRSER